MRKHSLFTHCLPHRTSVWLPWHTVQRCVGHTSAPCWRTAPPAPTDETCRASLQLPHAPARARLKLQHKCPHIIAECVNHTVTSQGHLTSTIRAVFSGPKATGHSPRERPQDAAWETKVSAPLSVAELVVGLTVTMTETKNRPPHKEGRGRCEWCCLE